MANHKSAIKKTRRDERKRLINKKNRSKMRNVVKKIKLLISDGNIEEAKTLFPKAISIIDKTVTKGIIHKNAAARYKSRINKAIENAS